MNYLPNHLECLAKIPHHREIKTYPKYPKYPKYHINTKPPRVGFKKTQFSKDLHIIIYRLRWLCYIKRCNKEYKDSYRDNTESMFVPCAFYLRKSNCNYGVFFNFRMLNMLLLYKQMKDAECLNIYNNGCFTGYKLPQNY